MVSSRTGAADEVAERIGAMFAPVQIQSCSQVEEHLGVGRRAVRFSTVLTLRALLSDPALELRLLVPGPEGALDAEVVWVHNTELADPSRYVRERELVLTNGLWLETAEPAGFVAGVRRAGAAGIVFGLRAERTSTPDELVDACRATGLPLLEISVEVPFTAITRAAATSASWRSAAHRAAEVPGRLRAFGVDPDAPLAVCAVAFRSGDPTLPGMVEAITDFFLAESLPALVAGGSRDVVAVLPWRRQQADLTSLAGRLVAALAARFPDSEPVAGIGGTAADAAELRRPLAQAREAVRVLRERRGGPDVTTFAELGGYRLLLGLQEPEQLQRFADTVLGPLREHDRRRGGELETTLRAFLDHDGHWGATAEALFVHVNTLRNRLARVAELTGRDVSRTADRVDLFLALEALAER